jgi:hypothetical protein
VTRATTNLPLSFTQGSENIFTLECCSGMSSSSHSMWHLKSMDALWAYMTPIPRVNSSVILAANTQVVSGHCPRVSFMKAFKMWRVSAYAIWRAHCMGGYISGSSEVMSGLAMVRTCSQSYLQTVMTAFMTLWVCNKEVWMVKPSPSPFLIFVSPILVSVPLGSVDSFY